MLIGRAGQALLSGELPDADARVYLAGALLSWLENGGDLARDYLQVTKPKSHHTPSAIWHAMRAHQDERQDENQRP